MQSVETQRIQNRHHNLTCIICEILRLTSVLSEQARRDGLKKQTVLGKWKSQNTESVDLYSCVTNLTITLFVLGPS